MASPSESALRSILDVWRDLPGDASIARLDGGHLNDVYLVEGQTGRRVLRVCVAETTLASLEWEHELMAALDDRRVPQPIPTISGSTVVALQVNGATRLCWLSPYLEGSHLRADEPAHARAAATALAQLHRRLQPIEVGARPTRPALLDLDWRENTWWSWSRRGETPLGPERLKRLDVAVEDAARELERLARIGWDVQPLHGDFYAGNLRVDAGRISAIFDWDEARIDWRACDVADALWAFCSNEERTGFDEARASQFLDTYADAADPLEPSERDALPTLIRIRRTWEALAGLGEAQRGREFDLDYLDASLRAIESLQRR
jgi:Ser/Thr protein kinase RdoA (MazF antagonist)